MFDSVQLHYTTDCTFQSHLVLCIHRCLMICERNAPNHSDDSEEHGEDVPRFQLRKLMQGLIKVMVDAELEDFSLVLCADLAVYLCTNLKMEISLA